MTRYARIDNNAPFSPKVQAFSDAEFRVWIASICYADQFKTDGHIPAHALRVIGASERIKTGLITKGGWEANGAGIYVHDYLHHQRSKAQIEAATTKARKAAEERHK